LARSGGVAKSAFDSSWLTVYGVLSDDVADDVAVDTASADRVCAKTGWLKKHNNNIVNRMAVLFMDDSQAMGVYGMDRMVRHRRSVENRQHPMKNSIAQKCALGVETEVVPYHDKVCSEMTWAPPVNPCVPLANMDWMVRNLGRFFK
jgi:hypothetical protein